MCSPQCDTRTSRFSRNTTRATPRGPMGTRLYIRRLALQSQCTAGTPRAGIPASTAPRAILLYSIPRPTSGITKPSKFVDVYCCCWAQLTSSHLFSLAIGRMFGGIPESFYMAYHKHLPKAGPQEQYDLRQDLYQLYHYLNHTVLFGVRSLTMTNYMPRAAN